MVLMQFEEYFRRKRVGGTEKCRIDFCHAEILAKLKVRSFGTILLDQMQGNPKF